LTEAVRIVTRMTRKAQVSAGEAYDLGYHVVWCPRYHRPLLAAWAGSWCAALVRARSSGQGWRIMACQIVPDHVHLLVTAHLFDSPSRIVSQFTDVTSRRLRTGFPHLLTRLPALWSRPYCAATADAASSQTMRRCTGMQNERWRKGRAW
jgi:putative transposase